MGNDIASREDIEKYLISSLQFEDSHQIIEEQGIKDIHFSPGTLRDLFRLSLEYFNKYSSPMTPKVFMDKVSRLSFSAQAKANLHANLIHINNIETNSKDIPYYCSQLKNYLAGDILRSSFEDALSLSKEGGEGANIKALEKLQESLGKGQSLLETESVVRIVDGGEELETIIQRYHLDRIKNPEKYIGIKCGIKEIDEAFSSPLGSGELTLFMAPPGGGKTTVMLAVADAIWRNSKKNVLYASLEMDVLKIGMKHVCNNAAVSFSNMEEATLTEVNKKSLIDTFDERREISKKAKMKFMEISTAGLISTRVLEANIKALLASGLEIDVLFVDYLELLYAPEAARDDHWIKMGHVCKFLRGLGKKYGFSVVSAVQMKRDAISRIRKSKDERKDFGADDAQGSNQISADADRIFALWIDPKDERYIRLYTAKNRYGNPRYECSLYFDASCSRIYGDTTSYDHDQVYDENQFQEIIDLANSYDENSNENSNNFGNLISDHKDIDLSEIDSSYMETENEDEFDGDIEELMNL